MTDPDYLDNPAIEAREEELAKLRAKLTDQVTAEPITAAANRVAAFIHQWGDRYSNRDPERIYTLAHTVERDGKRVTQEDALLTSDLRLLLAAAGAGRTAAWSKGHEAGRDYQGDGWNCDAHDPEEDNPYRALSWPCGICDMEAGQ